MSMSSVHACALHVALLFALSACASQDVDYIDPAGNRVVAPPPTIPMVMLGTGIDRSWPGGKPETIVTLDLTLSRLSKTNDLFLEHMGVRGGPGPGRFKLSSGNSARSHTLVIQSDGGDGKFKGRLGTRVFRFSGTGDDTGWDDKTTPSVTLAEHSSGPDSYVEVVVKRGNAVMTFNLWNTELQVHTCTTEGETDG